jgi:tetratricopeptide (TPR) repeat protein
MSDPTLPSVGRPSRWPTLGGIALVIAAGLLAYANSFSGRFVLDDPIEIVGNPTLRTLWPPWVAMMGGNQVAARPLPYLSFAIDLAIWGPSPAGFHLTNLLVHLATACGLFLLTEATLARSADTQKLRAQATPIAAAAAAIWVAHPLTTAAVTYVYQRIEALAACLIVWSLYCAARSFPIAIDDPGQSAQRRRWQAAAIGLAAAAMLSKETAVVLPVLVVLYWWIFATKRNPRPRLPFFAGIASTWGVLAIMLRSGRGAYAELGQAVHPPLLYFLTQTQVILHYLRLAIWPVGLCLDYDWPLVDGIAAAAGPLAVVLVAFVAAAIAAFRRRLWAFPGLAFFILLAPTSSVMPVADVAFDHRMYLPLFCVVVLVAGSGWWAVGRYADWFSHSGPAGRGTQREHDGPRWAAVATAAGIVLALAWATHLRNRDFHDPRILWSQALQNNPQAFRANWWAAVNAAAGGDVDRAIDHAARSTRRMPNGLAFHEVARLFCQAGDLPAWARTCRVGIATLDENRWSGRPTWFDLHALLAESLLARGDTAAAAEVCRSILPRAHTALPEHHAITIGLRLTLLRCRLDEISVAVGVAEAEELLRDALAGLGPGHPKALAVRSALAVLLDRAGDAAAAEQALREVIRLQRASAGSDAEASAALETLANFLASHGRHAETVPLWSEIWQVRGRSLGAGHPRSRAAGGQLVKALEVSGQAAEARAVGRLLEQAAGPEPAVPPDD